MCGRVMYSGSPCYNELNYWLKVSESSQYQGMVQDYPPASTNFFTLVDACYDRTSQCMWSNFDAIVSHVPDLDIDLISSGLTVALMEFLKANNYYGLGLEYRVPNTSGVVGPYTVTLNRCENGLIYGIGVTSRFITVHQSVDGEMLLQDETQKTLSADLALSDISESELDADVALRANIPIPFEASMPLRGEVRPPLSADIAIRDESQVTFDADCLLSVRQTYDLAASARLIAVPWSPLDADICIIGPALKPFSAYMLLLPDTASEMLTELEKYHFQAARIKADPRSYKEYNSKTDTEVVP